MNTSIDALLAGLPVVRWGTVVWVGPSDAQLPSAVGRHDFVDRWVVAVGEGDSAARLRAQARGLPQVFVHHAVLAERAGRATWHRYNFPRWNGLAEPDDAVRRGHPRLTEVDRCDVPTEALSDFVQALSLPAATGQPNGLVLDGTADTAALLDSLPDAVLTSFQWIAAAHVNHLPDRLAQRFSWAGEGGRGRFLVGRLDRAKLDWIARQAEWQAQSATLQGQLEQERRAAQLLDERLLRAEAKLELLRSWVAPGEKL